MFDRVRRTFARHSYGEKNVFIEVTKRILQQQKTLHLQRLTAESMQGVEVFT